MGKRRHWFEEPLEELLAQLADYDFSWTTLTKGIEGFGSDQEIHKKTLFSLSDDVPIVIEAAGKHTRHPKRITRFKRNRAGRALPAQVEVNT